MSVVQGVGKCPNSFATLLTPCELSIVIPAQPACRAIPLRKAGEPGSGVSQPDTFDRAALPATRAQRYSQDDWATG